MLIQEAHWFAKELATIPNKELYPMCNIGSSTNKFRLQEQPWIDEFIFSPILQQGYTVKHLDIKADHGVDIVGDICDPNFLKQIDKLEFKSFFCSNLLEHLEERDLFCQALASIIPPKGYLFVSAPCIYPYHPDPIDNGFRPSVKEIASLFPGTSISRAEVVVGDTILRIRSPHPVIFAFTLMRPLIPFYKPQSWWRNKGYIPWFFRKLAASCVILRKV